MAPPLEFAEQLVKSHELMLHGACKVYMAPPFFEELFKKTQFWILPFLAYSTPIDPPSPDFEEQFVKIHEVILVSPISESLMAPPLLPAEQLMKLHLSILQFLSFT